MEQILLNWTQHVLQNASSTEDSIERVQRSPDNKVIVVDMKFNKALTVRVRGFNIIIEGDTQYSEILGNILKERLENGNNL